MLLSDEERLRLADDLGNQLVQAGRFIAQHAPQWIRDSGMESAGFQLLAQLVVNGPQRVGDLAAAFGLDRTTVSRQLAELYRAGLAEQLPDGADKRARVSGATARGAAQFRAVRAQRSEALAEILREWPADDIGTLVALLRRLTRQQSLPFAPFEEA